MSADRGLHELRKGALGFGDSTMIGISGTAPAASVASSTATLVAVVGLATPGSIVIGALAMFGIALAFLYLGRWRCDAGASYSWVGRSLNPTLGFLCGWAVLVTSTFFVAPGSFPAASSILDLAGTPLAQNLKANAVVGALSFSAVSALALLGINVTARFQQAVTAIEVAILFALGGAALAKGLAHPIAPFSWAWFAPVPPGGLATFFAGALIAVFFFWGWDVTANLNEETRAGGRTPGLGGAVGLVVILVLFAVLQVGMQLVLTPQQIAEGGTNLVSIFANTVFGRPWGNIAVIAVVLSVIGTLETQMVQVGRTLFSMARDGVVSARLAELHPRFAAPWRATIIMWSLGMMQFALAGLSSSITEFMAQMINATGLLIAFYYGLAGVACAWYYRRTALAGRAFVLQIVWPALAATFLFVVAVIQVTRLPWQVDVVAIGALMLGLLPAFYYRRKYRSSFYAADREYALPDEHPVVAEAGSAS